MLLTTCDSVDIVIPEVLLNAASLQAEFCTCV